MGKSKKKLTPEQKERRAAARAAQPTAEDQRRMEAREKSARAGRFYVQALLTLTALLCFYTLLKYLLSTPKSLDQLWRDTLFLSHVSIPVLIAAGAYGIRRLHRWRSKDLEGKELRRSNLLFLLVIVFAFGLFGWQLISERSKAYEGKPVLTIVERLDAEGLTATVPEEGKSGYRTILEPEAWQMQIVSGDCTLTYTSHHCSLLSLAGRYYRQAGRDYADLTAQADTVDGKTVCQWSEKDRAALVIWNGKQVDVLEAASKDGTAAEIMDLAREALLG